MAQAAPVKKVHTQEPPAGTAPAADSPTKVKLVDEAASRSAPESPKTPPVVDGTAEGKASHLSPGQRGSNLKAEAFADAHTKRVEAETHAYIDAEVRKAEAHAKRQQAEAEKVRMREEAKAIETLKKEEANAEAAVHAAVLKADKIVAQAKEKAVMIKAKAKEASEKHIADANTHAQREKAQLEEEKSRKLAEIKDKAETMIAAGELITPEKTSRSTSIKQKLMCAAT